MPPSVGLSVLSTQVPGPARAPQHHTPIAPFSPCPSPHPPPATLQLQGCTPSQGKLGVCHNPWSGDEKARLILHFPSKTACLWPHAESQRVGFKKDQRLAEVSSRPSFIQGKTFLILIATWTMHRKGDALWLHQQEGSCTANARTSISGNAFTYISKIWKKGHKRFLPEKSIKSTVTIVQETLQHHALGQTSRRKLT